MHWIVPTEKNTESAALENRFWVTADSLRRANVNPELKPTRRDFREVNEPPS